MTEKETGMTVTDYIEQHGITVEIVKDRGIQSTDDWPHHHAYRLRLKRTANPYDGTPDEQESPVFDWHQGSLVEGLPEADTVLDALVSDATSYRLAMSFDDFAKQFGYDSDSRKAEAIYKACGEVAEWLRVFLNGDLDYVAYELERL